MRPNYQTTNYQTANHRIANKLSRRAMLASTATLGAGWLFSSGRPAKAEAGFPISIAMTSGAPDAPILVARERGMFAAHGLEVKPVILPLMPSLPAALQSGSVQIAFMVPTTFLQANEGGLDLVTIAGGGVGDTSIHDSAALARPGVAIEKPADFIGKSVGVPGLGAAYHVLFRHYLMENGVDPARVHFLEVAFPSMADALRAKSVDAVVALEPFLYNIVTSGAGRIVASMADVLPNDIPIVFFVATRAWADAHRPQVVAFRAAMADADAATEANRPAALVDMAKYVHMPPAALQHASIGAIDLHTTPQQLGWWVKVMTDQGMLTGKPDVKKLVLG